jgi:Domain of unknown function (DUF4384)
MKTLQQLYDEYESDLIEAMINRFKFSGKQKIVFSNRFIKINDGCLHQKLADDLKKSLIDEKKSQDVGQIYRQTLAAICDKMEEMGCPPSTGTDRWKNCRYWLREEMFAQWAKEQGLIPPDDPEPPDTEQCWQELKEKVNTTTGLTVEIPALSNMGARPNRKRHEIPVNSDLIYRVDSPKTGHLILFEREPNGTIVCLCPSEFAPESYHAGKETVLPHPDSEYQYFGSDELGWEQLLAVITPELPPFQWLEDSRQEALEVNQDHLAGLLDYVNSQPNTEVLYTEYLVINA